MYHLLQIRNIKSFEDQLETIAKGYRDTGTRVIPDHVYGIDRNRLEKLDVPTGSNIL